MLLKNEKAAAMLAALPEVDAIRAAAAELTEYGYVKGNVAAQWAEKSGAARVVCALNNSDLDHMLAVFFEDAAESVVLGLAAAAKAVGAAKTIVYLPEDRTAGEAKLKELAKAAGISCEIRTGFVAIREHLDDVIHHPQTLAALAAKLTGEDANTTVVAFNFEGKIHTPVEVAFGTPLSTLITMENVKAVKLGGSILPASALSETITPELQIGSGVITVLDDKQCVAQAARDELVRYRATSCGKCTFCREGLYQLTTIFTEMTENKSKPADLELSSELCEAMKLSTCCSLGSAAADPAITAIAAFKDELDKHVKHKGCPTGQCKSFVTFYIDPEACEGCGDCIDVCPKECIEGKSGYISMIDEFECSRCGKCLEACENGAVQTATGRLPKLPTRLTKVGKFKKR